MLSSWDTDLNKSNKTSVIEGDEIASLHLGDFKLIFRKNIQVGNAVFT